MVGAAAMGPEPFEVTPLPHETDEDAHRRVLQRFERIGLQIMNRTGGGPFMQDPVSGALSDPAKRALAAQILGQAYVAAHNLVVHNRESIGVIADALTQKREIFGDDLLELLDGARLEIPKVDLSEESAWPPLEFSAHVGGPPRAALTEQVSGNGGPGAAE
jgi:hypothetical protein